MIILVEFKVLNFISIAPGPGSYRLPSDFGQYDEINPKKHRELLSKGTDRTKAEGWWFDDFFLLKHKYWIKINLVMILSGY